MPANPVKIGPFSGGLNTYSDPTAVADTECVDIQNFDVDLDGSLISRPPITVKDDKTTINTGTSNSSGKLRALGWYTTAAGVKYLICAAPTGGTYARKHSDGTWTLITNTFTATCMVQYQNKVWLVASPSSANPGGNWDGTTFTAVAAIPKGTAAVVYKERMFVAGGKLDTTNANRVNFSNAGNFSTWTSGTDFFDVKAGDGQHIVDIKVFQDTIVVFKEDSTYLYSYDTRPANGAVRAINNVIGCPSSNTVVEYENSLYVYHEASVYQINNWNFTLINLKVPFANIVKWAFSPQDATLSVVGNRLIVRHFDAVYVFGLRTGTWTKWDTTSQFDYFINVPIDTAEDPEEYLGFSRETSNADADRVLYSFINSYAVNRLESMTCYVLSKSYDFGVPYTYKKLFWWGVDFVSKKDLSYIVHPITNTRPVTHQMLAAYQHQQIIGSHAQPLDVSIDVSSSFTVSNGPGNRLFVKLLKAMRFRQISFKITGTNDGTTTQGPLRIFTVTAMIDNKEKVSKQVS